MRLAAPLSAPLGGTLQSIAISPLPAALTTGQSLQLSAFGHYSNGSTANLTSQVTWISSDDSVLTVVGGLVTVLVDSYETVKITASL